MESPCFWNGINFQFFNALSCVGTMLMNSSPVQNKELIKDKMNGCRVPLIVGSGSIKNSLGKLPAQIWASFGEVICKGTYKQNKCGSNYLPYCRLSPLKFTHSLKLGTADIGSSSNDGVIAIEVGETCFADNAVSMDDLPDLQVPGSDGMEPDLLFDLSSNILSFHEAEFLQQPVWTKSKEESESNQVSCFLQFFWPVFFL